MTTRTGVLVLIAVLSIATVGVGAAITAADDGGTAIESDTVEIAPEVQTADGTQTVIVSFERAPEGAVAESADTVDTLQTHADQTQAPLQDLAAETPGLTITNEFWLGNLAVVELDHERVDVEQIAALDGVESISPNFEVSLHDGVTSQSAASQPHGTDQPGFVRSDAPTQTARVSTTNDYTWGVEKVNAPDVWEEFDTRGEGASVAVLDTGVEPGHPDIPDIPDEQWGEWDSFGNEIDSEPQDYGEDGHGTHVSGTVVGGAESGQHIGVAPDATLYHGAVLSDNGGTFPALVAGMEWAVENDVDAMSMSLGFEAGEYIDDIVGPVRDAEDAGTIVISSIGNDGEGTSGSPGNVYDTLSVGASASDDSIESFSSGEEVSKSDWENPPSDWPDEYIVPTVSAPGSAVNSAVPGGEYSLKSGTSMAAPHVSAAAALMVAASGDDLSVDDVESGLIDSAWKPDGDPDDQDTRYGHGIVDAYEAVDAVADQPATFEVTIDETNSPVTESETLSVDATVENVGDVTDSQTVALDIDGVGVVDTTERELDGGATASVSLDWETEAGDAGNYTATVETDDDSASTEVSVEEMPELLPYANDDDIIDTDGLTAVIDDWAAGNAELSLVRDAIDYWQSGEPVTS